MLSVKLEEALNEQLNFEVYSGYIYLSMSAWLSGKNLNGMAHWMQLQYNEELMHAMKIFAYINDRGGKVVLKAIQQPQTDWKSVLDVFETAYRHEQSVTGRFGDLTDLALSERDHVTNVLLQWFINEQIEEEASVKEIADQIAMAGESRESLFMLDREMAQRQAAPAGNTGKA